MIEFEERTKISEFIHSFMDKNTFFDPSTANQIVPRAFNIKEIHKEYVKMHAQVDYFKDKPLRNY